MQIKLNQDLNTPQGKILKDAILTIESEDNLPTSQFWRSRLKDSKIDNCIEIIKDIKIKNK